MRKISIADDYSKTPGGRYKSDGEFSGEDFRENILLPQYKTAERNNEKISIDLDGGYGYGSSFLEEAFGGLVRELGKVDVDKIEIISNEEPQLKKDILKYITDAEKGAKRDE